MTEAEMPPVPEKVGQKAIFEHLYPGNKWNQLTLAHPLNIIPMVEDLLVRGGVRDAKFGEAVETKQGYADRIDLPRPDKMTLAYLLLDTFPINQIPNKGWVSDLLKDGERLGGMSLRQIAWMNRQARMNGVRSVGESAMNKNVQLFDQAPGLVIGVLNEKGQPSGLITFRKGERPSQGERERRTMFIGVGKPEPVRVIAK